MTRANCCSMRERRLRFTVINNNGQEVATTFDEPSARKMAMTVRGTWREEWVDAQTGR